MYCYQTFGSDTQHLASGGGLKGADFAGQGVGDYLGNRFQLVLEVPGAPLGLCGQRPLLLHGNLELLQPGFQLLRRLQPPESQFIVG